MTSNTRSSTPPNDVERREFDRQYQVQFVWYRVLDFAQNPKHADTDKSETPQEGLAKLYDISMGGVGLNIPEPLTKGAYAFVEIATNTDKICFIGTVVRCSKRDDIIYDVGIEIFSMPPYDRLVLKSFCKANGKIRL